MSLEDRLRGVLRGGWRWPRPRWLPQQIVRLSVIFALAAAGLVAARRTLVPPTFGADGHYRSAAVADVVAAPLHYAGRAACANCHSDVIGRQAGGRHRTVACEACHGPAAAHVDSGGESKPIVPRGRDFCPACHGYDAARPTGFPQIDPVAHNPMRACVSCHQPHEPVPPNVPASCGACHGEIARVKSVSHHVTLECTRCHETDVRHRDTPSASRPSKPQTRQFCGGCHDEEAKSSPEIPRIPLAAHGAAYLCWQCHYPHDPEVR